MPLTVSTLIILLADPDDFTHRDAPLQVTLKDVKRAVRGRTSSGAGGPTGVDATMWTHLATIAAESLLILRRHVNSE